MRTRSRTASLLAATSLAVLLAACSPPEPVRLGFIGGLSGRVADLGESARNGFHLAVEQANAAGGINGRQIEMLVKDDGQDPAKARQAAEALVAAGVVAIIGPGTTGVMIAIAVAYLAQFTRLTRAQIMTLKGETFIEATRSLGAGNAHILFRHLLPNALAPVLVSAMLATGDAIILEATLGFFGLGAQPPVPSWGGMMSAGSTLVFKAPWVIIYPGLAVAITVVAINIYGDALIAELDIRSRLRRDG